MNIIIGFVALLAAVAPLPAMAQDECGIGTMRSPLQYGPFDYRSDKDKLEIVELAHFTPDVEQLRQGISGYVGADLDYTLRAFPNHHRALLAMANLAIKEHKIRPKGARYTVDCYFERAVRFAGDDGTVRMIRGVFLDRLGKKQEALAEFKESEKLDPNNVNLQYNMGLAYFDRKQFDLALQYAQQAYRGGATLPGLKKKLIAAGMWKEPPPAEPKAPADGAAAGAAPTK